MMLSKKTLQDGEMPPATSPGIFSLRKGGRRKAEWGRRKRGKEREKGRKRQEEREETEVKGREERKGEESPAQEERV